MLRKRVYFISILTSTFLLVLLQMFCRQLYAQADTAFPVLHGKYLGQPPPGLHAIMFCNGLVSTGRYEHSAPTFSPEGDIVLWGTIDRDKPSVLWEMRKAGDTWLKPTQPSFTSGTHDDMYPYFSPDGKKLFFGSRRPLPGGRPVGDMRIWVVDRLGTSWGQPYLFDTVVTTGFEYAHSWARNGNMYFSARRPAEGRQKWNIYCSQFINGKYQLPVLLDSNINDGSYVDGPCISPDESFLIFESDRKGGFGSLDLYICFKQSNGGWGKPVNMGHTINSAVAERFAGVSPDGKYLFFGSNRERETADVYWIDAGIINELKHSNP